ncbi:MAG: hypothetical protein AAGC54_07565 [Cyanobacteria bacterium P01_F01_bin.4]
MFPLNRCCHDNDGLETGIVIYPVHLTVNLMMGQVSRASAESGYSDVDSDA